MASQSASASTSVATVSPGKADSRARRPSASSAVTGKASMRQTPASSSSSRME